VAVFLQSRAHQLLSRNVRHLGTGKDNIKMDVKDNGVRGYELNSSQFPKKTLLHGVGLIHDLVKLSF
jgi:hypothetical protein